MSPQNSLKTLFTFSKKERVGILCIIPAILIIAWLPFFRLPSAQTKPSIPDSAWLAAANTLQQKEEVALLKHSGRQEESTTWLEADITEGSYSSTTVRGTVFNFNPNTLDADGFKRLGLRDKTIKTLLNYRNKGGRFRKPDDLRKIYGLRSYEFERLKPYIDIPEKAAGSHNGSYSNIDRAPARSPEATPPYGTRHSIKTIDINTTDIAGFESLYGIGNKLAARIVNFREKLGGFYSTDQVGETYGVPDSTFQKIKAQLKVNASLVKKIPVNAATYEALNNHPYISGKTAFQILKHRKEKGKFSNIDEIKELLAPTDSYDKISRYITVED